MYGASPEGSPFQFQGKETNNFIGVKADEGAVIRLRMSGLTQGKTGD